MKTKLLYALTASLAVITLLPGCGPDSSTQKAPEESFSPQVQAKHEQQTQKQGRKHLDWLKGQAEYAEQRPKEDYIKSLREWEKLHGPESIG